MKVQNYIQGALFVDFAFAVGGMFVLCLPGVAIAATSRFGGCDLEAILKIVPLVLAGLLPFVLPVGYLLAVVVTYGRLAADNEWTAMRMAGMHPIKLLLPALPLALFLGAGSLWFMAQELPHLRVVQDRTAFNVLRGAITNLSPGRTELHLGKFNLVAAYREGDDFLDAVIYLPATDGKQANIIAASRVRFAVEGEVMLMYLHQAHVVSGTYELTSETTIVRIDLEELRSGAQRKYDALRYKTSSDLYAELDQPGLDRAETDTIRFEIHERDAIGTIYIMFMLLGIPIGLLMQRGTQLAALSVAVLVAILYYVLAMRAGQQLAARDLLSPLLCAWAVNGLGLLVGAILMRKALRQ